MVLIGQRRYWYHENESSSSSSVVSEAEWEEWELLEREVEVRVMGEGARNNDTRRQPHPSRHQQQ